jgi:hypothetical protein
MYTKNKMMVARWFALCALLAAGCSDPEPDKPKADMAGGQDMPVVQDDMDVTPDVAPDEDMAPDLVQADMAPERCPGAPPCEQGYQHDLECICKAPINRVCTTNADCRAGEECTQFESAGVPVSVCMLDESKLVAEVCPGGAGCAAAPANTPLLGAMVARVVTPDGFETAKPAGLDGVQLSFDPPLRSADKWNDCGYDGLCPGDAGYTAPDRGEGDKELQGMWLAGFTNGRPAQYCAPELIGCDGVECCVSKYAHDDLMVNIAVFRHGETTVAFAALDSVGFFHTDIERIRQAIPASAGIDLLVMGALHNHEAPDTAGQWGPGRVLALRIGRDPVFLKKIQDQTVDGIVEAVGKLEEVELRAGIITDGVDGMAMGDSRPPYIVDGSIPVVRMIAKDDGESLGTMVALGNHVETLWSENVYITSDYPHYVRKHISEGLPEIKDAQGVQLKPAIEGFGGVTLMFAGAVGGLVNPGHNAAINYAGESVMDHGYAKAEALGQAMALKVLNRRESLEVVPSPTIAFATKRYLVPVRNTTFLLAAFIAKILERDLYNGARVSSQYVPGVPSVMSQVAVVRIGELSFFTAHGEMFPEMLVGGLPGLPRSPRGVYGDVEQVRTPAACGDDGLPTPGGDKPCIVSPMQENPPNWVEAPAAPYGYELVPGKHKFFIGLGMDFLGYMVPDYDFKAAYKDPDADTSGSHYEETNSIGYDSLPKWQQNIAAVIAALPD